MSDQQLIDLFDSVSLELDREAELVVAPTSPSALRSAASSRRRRRRLVGFVVFLVMILSVALVVTQGAARRQSPTWAASSSPTPVESAPARSPSATTSAGESSIVRTVVSPGDVMTMLGIGELSLGMPRTALVSRGVMAPVGGCDVISPSPTLSNQGILISSGSDTVDFIVLITAQHTTQSRAKVGMTMGGVKQIYGNAVSASTVTLEIGDPQGNTRQAYVLTSGNTLVFMSDSRGAIAPNDVVTSIYLLRGKTLSIPVEIC